MRWKDMAAMLLIGDGVMAMLCPHRDTSVWKMGPPEWNSLMKYLDDRPALTRLVGAVQVAATVAWVLNGPCPEGPQRESRHKDDSAAAAV
uniref:Uncharacterized protein n=2 Tax=Paracidobacterium acidisoli TaxID=2303751 RepID=A0A372IUY8_9BACT